MRGDLGLSFESLRPKEYVQIGSAMLTNIKYIQIRSAMLTQEERNSMFHASKTEHAVFFFLLEFLLPSSN